MNLSQTVVPGVQAYPISPNTMQESYPFVQLFHDPVMVARWYQKWCDLRTEHPDAQAVLVDHETTTCHALNCGLQSLDHHRYFYLLMIAGDIRICWMQIPVPYTFAN